MRKNNFKNGLVIGIGLLVIGIFFIPTILSQEIQNKPISPMRAVLWVDDDGQDCPNGTTYYETIQEAIDDASSGDQINVCRGTYYENVDVDKGLTLEGGHNGTSIIDGGGTDCVVILSAVSSINISNFTITNSGDKLIDTPPFEIDAGISVDVKFGGHKILNNNISDNNGNGIFIVNAIINVGELISHEIAGNTIANNAYDGISVFDSIGLEIYSNTFQDNGFDGIYFFKALRPKVYNNIVIGNGKSGQGHGGIHLQRTRGIPLDTQPTIHGNCISNNHGDGIKIEIWSLFNNIYKNNISNNEENGVCMEFQADLNTVWENNFIGNKKNAFSLGSFVNTWRRNYWDDLEDRSLPIYIIWGVILGIVPWPFNIDFYPVDSPYDYPCP